MALIKTCEHDSGIQTCYHNISLYKNIVDDYLEVTINSYISKDTRDAGKKPIQKRNILVPEKYWKNDERLETAAYNFLKEEDYILQGATDDI